MSEAVLARNYPTKPVRLIEPFGADGGPDLLARTLAQRLSELWDKPVTVENITGARFVLGESESAARIMRAAGIQPQKNP